MIHYLLILTLVSPFVLGAEEPPTLPPCFDFAPSAKRIVEPVKKPFKTPRQNKDEELKGTEDSTGLAWAAIRSTLSKPIGEVYKLLLDHRMTKSSSVDEFKESTIPDERYLKHQIVDFTVKVPVPFMNDVKWQEHWVFALLHGSKENPEEILTSYEKTQGTDYIDHLCGFIHIKKLSAKETEITLYEEALAEKTSQEDEFKGMKESLKNLRK